MNKNKLKGLPSYYQSRKLIEALFNFSPRSKPFPSDYFKNNKATIRETEKLTPKKTVGRPRKKAGSTAQHRRKMRELLADGIFTKAEWDRLKADFNGECLRCGTTKKILADHIKPLYLGGSGLIENIQPLCSDCNIWKGLKIIDFRPTFVIEIL